MSRKIVNLNCKMSTWDVQAADSCAFLSPLGHLADGGGNITHFLWRQTFEFSQCRNFCIKT